MPSNIVDSQTSLLAPSKENMSSLVKLHLLFFEGINIPLSMALVGLIGAFFMQWLFSR